MIREKSRFALLTKLVFTSAIAGLASGAGAATPVTNWQQTSVKSFYNVEAFTKSQGIASDGNRLFFSWNAGLHSMDLEMNNVLADNIFEGIPFEQKEKGLSHIGDIDFYNGRIYAPIEGKPTYEHSTIVTYDPDTLQPVGPRFELDRNYLPDGVPWIAIDATRQVAYTSPWNNVGVINIHRFTDFRITGTIHLSRPIPRIQGAKVYRGMLYAARDNGTEKSIEAVDLDTGTVTNLFDRDLGDENETEGIAFVTNGGGTTMVTADINQDDHGRVDVHKYRAGGDLTPPAITGMTIKNTRIKPGRPVVVGIESSEAATTTATWSRCVGGKKRPCGKLRSAGRPPQITLAAGSNELTLEPRSETWAEGKRFNPGRFRLSITPTDQADAIGATSSVNFAVRKKGSKSLRS